MKKLTIQQTFDKVVAHLLSMKKRSYEMGTFGGGCRYLTADGNRCAVGALIADEYILSADSCGPVDVSPYVQRYLAISGVPTGKKAIEILYALQCAHDFEGSWDEHGLNDVGLGRLTAIAKKYRLTMPEVSK